MLSDIVGKGFRGKSVPMPFIHLSTFKPPQWPQKHVSCFSVIWDLDILVASPRWQHHFSTTRM